jgi:asperthecin polyketide synthase
MEVLHAQVISENLNTAHLIKVEAELDLDSRTTCVTWYNLSSSEPTTSFATCTIVYEDPTAWAQEWARMTHLIQGRVEELTRLAQLGIANSINRNMAYTLFKNVVDYADKYRGMHTVVMSDLEAVADVILDPETHGNWHSAPHYIDSVCHIGGLVLNGSDASNTRDYFYVTPGWGSFRMAHRLEPQAKYRSYVRMFPTTEANMYTGDVYILQENRIVGMMGDMKFRRVPRLLMGRFFSPVDAVEKAGPARKTALEPQESENMPHEMDLKLERRFESPPLKGSTSNVLNHPSNTKYHNHETTTPVAYPNDAESAETVQNSVVTQALKLISRESGQELKSLTDEALFVELGIDSLMSLVLSEKFRNELKLEVNSTMFFQCENIGQFKEWLEDYC